FSSRRRHTRSKRDWSSDVCSSDLLEGVLMGRYLLRRLWQSALTLVLSSIVIFIGARAMPGDPARARAGEDADPETIAAIRADLEIGRAPCRERAAHRGVGAA